MTWPPTYAGRQEEDVGVATAIGSVQGHPCTKCIQFRVTLLHRCVCRTRYSQTTYHKQNQPTLHDTSLSKTALTLAFWSANYNHTTKEQSSRKPTGLSLTLIATHLLTTDSIPRPSVPVEVYRQTGQNQIKKTNGRDFFCHTKGVD
jgi:hypothetical protein